MMRLGQRSKRFLVRPEYPVFSDFTGVYLLVSLEDSIVG